MTKPTAPHLILHLGADLTLDDDVHLLNDLTEQGKKGFHSFKIALPFHRMKEMITQFPDSGISFGLPILNDVSPEAFTGTVAVSMAKNAKAAFLLIGTARERKRLAERTEAALDGKLKMALEAKMECIYCVDLCKELKPQLELLLKHDGYFAQKEPLLIIQPKPTLYKHYLPTKEELDEVYSMVSAPLKEILEERADKLSLIVELPADLAGFSEIVANSPFQGIFCHVSGIYPHAVHEEFAKIAHVRLEN